MTAPTVIFDLDDTLIVEEAVARASLRHVAAMVPDHNADHVADVVLETARRTWRAGPCHRLCADLGIASWEGLWSTFDGNHPVVDDLREWTRIYRPEVWRTALQALGVGDRGLATAMSDGYVECQRRGHPLIAGADRLVRSLQGRRRLGLLTNGPSDIQRLKLEGTGLAGCFDTVVVSGEVGVGKPDPGVFACALDALGATPQESVMVGDSWERDVVGARAVGMAAVWVAGGRPRPEGHPGVTVVDNVGELAELVELAI